MQKRIHKGLRTSIADGGLDIIELDQDVIDLQPDDRGENMFDRMDLGISLPKSRSPRDLDNEIDNCGDLRLPGEIHASKDDSRVDGCRLERHRRVHAGVQAYTWNTDLLPDGTTLRK